jgi:myo-inositol-1(or 4)-monophosphatase
MAAGDVIVREAGGRVSDKDGNALQFGRPDTVQRTMICAGPALHAQILARLRHVDLSKR